MKPTRTYAAVTLGVVLAIADCGMRIADRTATAAADTGSKTVAVLALKIADAKDKQIIQRFLCGFLRHQLVRR